MVVQEDLENSPAVKAPACHKSLDTQKQKEGTQFPRVMQTCMCLFHFSALLIAETLRGFSRAQNTLCMQRNPKFRASQWKFFCVFMTLSACKPHKSHRDFPTPLPSATPGILAPLLPQQGLCMGEKWEWDRQDEGNQELLSGSTTGAGS